MQWLQHIWDKSFIDLRYRILVHTCFWLFLFFFWTKESMVLQVNLTQHISVTLVGICFGLFLFYPLVYLIVPLFQRRRWLIATLTLVVYYILAVLFRTYNIELIVNWYNLKQTWVVGSDFWEQLYKTQVDAFSLFRTIFSSIPSLLNVIYLPLTIKFIRYAYRFNLENSRLQLYTLKSQINPHFFFNTLNNLQSFIIQNKRQKSIELLTRLGDFMRASLYDCDAEYISMSKEMELLANYIAIERTRFEDTADIRIRFVNEDPEYQIPPFVFLPFIENVFKHGGGLPTAAILLNIQLRNEANHIELWTNNKFDTTAIPEKGGIGIDNIRKRLLYYFPGRHQLEIRRDNDVFRLTLRISK